jgi:hypothetical protein
LTLATEYYDFKTYDTIRHAAGANGGLIAAAFEFDAGDATQQNAKNSFWTTGPVTARPLWIRGGTWVVSRQRPRPT